MDHALVQDAQHDVDHQDGHNQQQTQSGERGLEGLGGALEAWCRWKPAEFCAASALIWSTASPSEVPIFRLNEMVTAGNWPDVVDRKRPQRGRELGDGADGNDGAGFRANVQRRDGRGIALELLLQLEDDGVLVIGRQNGGNLALAVRGIERVLDLAGGDAVGRRRVAVDFDVDLRVANLQIAADVGQPRKFLHLGRKVVRETVQLLGIGAFHGELVERLAAHSADVRWEDHFEDRW